MRCPDCGSPLHLEHDLEALKGILQQGWPQPHGLSLLEQWRDFLPVESTDPVFKVSLGETQTPLLPSKVAGSRLGLGSLHFKVEIGPTLSLKDRGSAMCMLKALETGQKAVCVASSGNNAASVAAYAARAGLPAIVFVQRDASPAKLIKMLSYGARVVWVDGDMSAASRLSAQMQAQMSWMECGGPNPYRIASKRLVAYEIVSQMQGRAPDAVLFPCGGSAGIVAAHLGFTELHEMGLIGRAPRLIGVQFKTCDPISQAFERGVDVVQPVAKQSSFSDALMNNSPYWGDLALKAARLSGGGFLSVSDEQTRAAMQAMAKREGLFLEPAGAVGVAALKPALARKLIHRKERIVCTVTGHGLNAVQASPVGRDIPEPVEADPNRVIEYLRL